MMQNMCQIQPKIPTEIPVSAEIRDSQRAKNALNR